MFSFLKKIFLFVFAFWMNSSSLFAQASFSASISPSVIGKTETAELKFTVQNATHVETIVAPSLKDFNVLSGPNQESSMQMINGVTTQSNSITYIIQPKAIGTFTILPGTAQADGKIFHSNNLSLKVTKNPQGNSAAQSNPFPSPFAGMPDFNEPSEQSYNDCILKNGDNIQDKINKNIFIKADVDKTSCYVGEPIVATYKLYSCLQAESNVTKSPSFNGFSVIDLPPQDNGPHTEKLNGREYNVYTLLKTQLYPLQSGEIELGSIATDNTIHFIKEAYAKRQMNNMDDVFRNFMQTSIPAEGIIDQHASLESKPVEISVKPLPDENKPASFKQAVGDFQLSDTLDKNTFTIDDAGKLTITISGEGNMTLINPPDIAWPKGIEAFEPKSTDAFNKMQVPVTGSKTFAYSFTAEKPGTYTLPAIEFSFFDPKTNSYKTLSAKAIPVTILQGTGKHAEPQIPITNNATAAFPLIFYDYRFWIIIIAIALIIPGLFIWSKRIKKKHVQTIAPIADINSNSTLKNEEIITPKNYLASSTIKMMEQDTKGFYEALNKDIHNFLADYFNTTPEAINKKTITQEMDKRNAPIATTFSLQQLLDDIEWQLYTPFPENEKMQQHFETATALINSLSNQQA